jgi:RNA polymerase sigma-70 factor (ECF subfamily)
VGAETLAEHFGAAAGLERPDAPEASALGEKLAHVLATGRAAWPRIAITDEAFVEHLARHVRTGATPAAFLDSVHGGDLFLACGVSKHDRAALAYFEENFMARVPEYVLRIRIGRDVVEDVQQTLRERLIWGRAVGINADENASVAPQPKIAEYAGKGPLGGWLRVAAVRTALNRIRASATGVAAGAERIREDFSLGHDPELAYVKEHAHDLLSDAFKRAIASLDVTERTILRLHYLEGLTMDQLARLYQTPRSTIARRVAEVRQEVLAATETLLRDERRLSPSAVMSVIRQARSQLQLTISRILEAPKK